MRRRSKRKRPEERRGRGGRGGGRERRRTRGRGERSVKSLPLPSSSLGELLPANQHAALLGDSIGAPLAVARIPPNQEAASWLVGCWVWEQTGG